MDTLRDKLGLALAGGGFRASLFHIGVLQRLAQLDLLRYVEVISSVSGGSIVAALFILLLKREMERSDFNGKLDKKVYLKITDDLEKRMCLGIQKNLRTRLFLNPFNVFFSVKSGDHLSRTMARLYEKHLYRQTIDELDNIAPGPIRLKDIKINPAGKPIDGWGYADLDSYNHAQVSRQGSAIPKLILNATSLNTGSRFWFSASEMGEWDFGHLHYGDAEFICNELKPRVESERIAAGKKEPGVLETSSDPMDQIIAWWASQEDQQPHPDYWADLFTNWQSYFVHGNGRSDSLDALLACKPGILRLARRSAWYLFNWPNEKKSDMFGGLDYSQHLLGLANRLGSICHQYTERVHSWIQKLGEQDLIRLCELIDYTYLVRSADGLAASAGRDLAAFKLQEAVAASANFPPVFAPFQITSFYDDLHVSRFGLTDGGVYDNLGVIGLIDEGCNYIISSDTGMSGEKQRRVSKGRLGMMARIVSVLMDDHARQTKEILLERFRVSAGLTRLPRNIDAASAANIHQDIAEVLQTRELHGLAAFKIDSPEACEEDATKPLQPYSAKEVAQIRTDLDAFGDIEMDALIGQGYINAGLFLKRWFELDSQRGVPEHLMRRYDQHTDNGFPYAGAANSDGKAPPSRPCAKTAGDKLKTEAIKAAKKRIFKVFLIWHSPWCWVAWASFILLLLAGWAWLDGRQLDLVQSLQDAIIQGLFLNKLGLVGVITWRRLIITIAAGVVVVLLIGYLGRHWFDWVDKLRNKGHTGLARNLSFASRVPRLARAFFATLFIKLALLLVMWLIHLYSYLYLWATNLGPYGKSCRSQNDDH